jgi:3,4-dihydroxy 2-butanone 4-phosphate synthase/GTP cyclohydrolase II
MVFIRSPTPTLITDMLSQSGNPEGGQSELREYGVGAQILLDLGVRRMILLSNTPRSIIGLEGYGLTVVERRPISGEPPRKD